MKKIFLSIALIIAATAGRAGAEQLTLDQAVAEALANNPRIRQYQANTQAALSEKQAALSDFFPKLATGYSYAHLNDDPYMRVYGNRTVVNSRDQHHWEIKATQPLFYGLALSSAHRLAEIGVETRELESLQTKLEIARQARAAYFNLLAAIKGQEVAQAAEKKLTAHEEDSRLFFEQGLISRDDLLEIQVALAEALQESARADAGVMSARAAFNVALGRDYNQDTQAAEYAQALDQDVDQSVLVGQALENRPEIKLIEKSVASKDQEVRLAESSYFPRIDLSLKYEQNGERFGGALNDYSNDHNTTAGIQAQWVFFEAGKTRARAAKARHEQDALRQALRGAQDKIRLEVQQAYLDLGVSRKNMDTARTALEQAQEHWRIMDVKHRKQLATSTQLLDAVTYLTRAQARYYQALYGQGIARADLDWAVGKAMD